MFANWLTGAAEGPAVATLEIFLRVASMITSGNP